MKMMSINEEKLKNAFMFVSMFLGVVFLVGLVDNDAWFLMNSGRYVEAFGIPHIEPFTIHENLHFVMQQWLFAVGLWKIYTLFGIHGIMAFSVVAGIVLIYSLYRLNYLVSDGNKDTACFLTFLIGVLICLVFVRQRPQVVSSLVFIWEIYFLERYKPGNIKKVAAVFFAFSVLLINVHAAMWPMLFVFMLPYLIESIVGEKATSFAMRTTSWHCKELAVLAVTIFVAGFVNPYGTEAMMYTVHSYGYDEINLVVGEMKALGIRSFYGMPIIIMFILAVGYSRIKTPLRYILLSAGTALMAFLALRSVFLFLLFGGMSLAYFMKNWQGVELKLDNSREAVQKRKLLLMMMAFMDVYVIHKRWDIFSGMFTLSDIKNAVLLFLMFFIVLTIIFSILYMKKHRSMCTVMLGFSLVGFVLAPLFFDMISKPVVPRGLEASAKVILEQGNKEDIVLWTGYNDGSYMEFHGVRCYLDARAEIFMPDINRKKNILNEYVLLLAGNIDYRDFVRRYNFTHFLTTTKDPLYESLKHDDNYILIFDSLKEGIDDSIGEDDPYAEYYRVYAVKKQ
ncbi:hypothetical protein [Anaerovibrio sp.]|uniref:hypothetical protein n=1 Tax=Anaerovibrio sp. TaxID=1872532 RepID=UPI003F188569